MLGVHTHLLIHEPGRSHWPEATLGLISRCKQGVWFRLVARGMEFYTGQTQGSQWIRAWEEGLIAWQVKLPGLSHLLGGQCEHTHIQPVPAEGSSTLCVFNLHPRWADSPRVYTESGHPKITLISFLWVSTLVWEIANTDLVLDVGLRVMWSRNEYTTRNCHHRQEVTLIKYCESWKVFTAWIFAKKKL